MSDRKILWQYINSFPIIERIKWTIYIYWKDISWWYKFTFTIKPTMKELAKRGAQALDEYCKDILANE